LGILGGLQEWPIQWNHAKCCGADPYCHGYEIWARRGDPFAPVRSLKERSRVK